MPRWQWVRKVPTRSRSLFSPPILSTGMRGQISGMPPYKCRRWTATMNFCWEGSLLSTGGDGPWPRWPSQRPAWSPSPPFSSSPSSYLSSHQKSLPQALLNPLLSLNFYLGKGVKKLSKVLKHLKNCECCPCHSLFKGHYECCDCCSLLIYCHKCNKCLKGHKCLGSLFQGAL